MTPQVNRRSIDSNTRGRSNLQLTNATLSELIINSLNSESTFGTMKASVWFTAQEVKSCDFLPFKGKQTHDPTKSPFFSVDLWDRFTISCYACIIMCKRKSKVNSQRENLGAGRGEGESHNNFQTLSKSLHNCRNASCFQQQDVHVWGCAPQLT